MSSSGVRNLRAMFENKDDEASPSRSRSPAGSTTSENRRTSKVRASFVSVEAGSSQMDSEVSSRPSTRRESFSLSESQDADKIAELKTTVSQEKEQRKQCAGVETIPESAIEATPSASPAIKPRTERAMGDFVSKSGTSSKNTARPSQDAPGMNPDKTVSAVEETPATMRPTDPKDERAVSGGEALPPPAEPIPKPSTEVSQTSPAANKPSSGASSKVSSAKEKLGAKPNGTTAAKAPHLTKPTDIKPTAKATSSRPSTGSTKAVSTIKSPGSVTAPKSPSTRPSRTSLESTKSTTSSRSSAATKPTAASAAKKAAHTQTTSDQTKSKPRSPTRPVKLPSHLMAPTASSAAKHGDAPSTATSIARKPASRPPTATPKPAPAPKPAATRRDAPRQSLPATSTTKRPESRTNTHASDDSFLARMMRPTASSASKSAEKTEVKSPPKRAASVRTKPSTQSLVGKAKKAVPTTSKGEEFEQNGTTSPDKDPHEGHNSVAVVSEDGAAEEHAHEVQEELPETPETPRPETLPEPVSEAKQEVVHDPVPESEPAPEPAQPSTNEDASTAAQEAPPEAAKAVAPGSTEEQPSESAQEISQEASTSGPQEPEEGLETPEKGSETIEKAEPHMESTPNHTQIADNALEHTPAFDGATIR